MTDASDIPKDDAAAKRPKPGLWKLVAFSALTLVLFVAAVEAALRISGFRYEAAGPQIVANGVRQDAMFQPGVAAEWAPVPGRGGFNRDGFLGPVIDKDKPPGTLRIATVGDSCTHWGDPPYPQRLQALLDERLDQPVEALNAGVAGYSTHQGLQRLKHDVLPYRPDIVVLFLGWNDQWLWREVTDSQYESESPAARRFALRLAAHSRAIQAAHLVRDTLVAFGQSDDRPRSQKTFRVPPEEFRQNLHRLIGLVRESGATCILVALPTNMTEQTPPSAVGILDGLEEQGYSGPKDLHSEYLSIILDVAEETDVILADAYSDFLGKGGLLTDDHVHLTDEGMQRMAELLAQLILQGRNP